ncbi:MAG: sigma factor-like helix-turn-helix DNA-binding protein [Planctomycetota bacterium]
MNRFDQTRPFGPWLRGIARKLVLAFRRQRGRSRVYLCDEETLDAIEMHWRDFERLEGETFEARLLALRDCLGRLTTTQQQSIRLYYDGELDCKRTAEHMSMQVETVKKLLQSGRAALAHCMRCKLSRSLQGVP